MRTSSIFLERKLNRLLYISEWINFLSDKQSFKNFFTSWPMESSSFPNLLSFMVTSLKLENDSMVGFKEVPLAAFSKNYDKKKLVKAKKFTCRKYWIASRISSSKAWSEGLLLSGWLMGWLRAGSFTYFTTVEENWYLISSTKSIKPINRSLTSGLSCIFSRIVYAYNKGNKNK